MQHRRRLCCPPWAPPCSSALHLVAGRVCVAARAGSPDVAARRYNSRRKPRHTHACIRRQKSGQG
eukprot:366417-Chlamydomonas_euryale.AAC.4